MIFLILMGCSSADKKADNKKTSFMLEAKANTIIPDELSVHSVNWVQSTTCPQGAVIERTKDWHELVKYANRCLAQKKTKELYVVANRLAETQPTLPWGAFYLSLEAELENQDERALWMIDLALRKSPKTGVLKYQRGRLFWKKGFYKECVNEMEEALKLDNTITEAHLTLGEAYLNQLNFNVARGHFEAVLQKMPQNITALTGLANVYVELENASGALGVLQSAIASYPKNLSFRVKEAFVYENLAQQSEVALFKLKEIQSLLSKKALDGKPSFDLDAKIKDLESTVKAERQLASSKESKERK